MMEVPAIIKTWVDSDGVTVYTVQYKDGSTCDMTVQQYDYLKASAQAVADMDSKASADSQPVETPVPLSLHRTLQKVQTSATAMCRRKLNCLLRGV